MSPPAWLGSHWLTPHYLAWLAKGALITICLAAAVCVAATVAGIACAAFQGSRWRWLRVITNILLNLHRNTPLMVQLLLWYFGIAGLLPLSVMQWLNTPHTLLLLGEWQLTWPSFEVTVAFIALTLYSASFIAGELRAGIGAIPKGQHQAGLALGMSLRHVFFSIVLPQVLRIIRRPLVGQYTAVIKNTSLTMAIGVAELSYTSRQVETETLLAFQAFAIATVFYLAMVLIVQSKKTKGISLIVPRHGER